MRYLDPNGRESCNTGINALDELLDCIDSIDIGLRDEFEINIPNFLYICFYCNLMSVGCDSESGNDAKYSQGIGASVYMKIGDVTLCSFSVEFSRQGTTSQGYNSPLDLSGLDFELSKDLDLSSKYEVTLPIPGFSISINVYEVKDYFDKAFIALEMVVINLLKELYLEE